MRILLVADIHGNWPALQAITEPHDLCLCLGDLVDYALEPAPCIAWVRQTYPDMAPYFASARYVNYLDDDDVGDPVAAAYGPNYRRLQKLKTKYDPDNFFRVNQNIRPGS